MKIEERHNQNLKKNTRKTEEKGQKKIAGLRGSGYLLFGSPAKNPTGVCHMLGTRLEVKATGAALEKNGRASESTS